MTNTRMVYDCLLDRPSYVSVNVNGFGRVGSKMKWRALVWINGYAFEGIEWDTQDEAARDAERVEAALTAWRGHGNE